MPALATLAQLLAAGTALGAAYALAAVGFVLLWQTARVVNFAQGEFVTLPAFALVVLGLLGVPFPLAFLLTLAASALVLGLGVKRLLVGPLLGQGLLPFVIATIGVGLLVRYGLQEAWTPLALPFAGPFSQTPLALGGVVVSAEDLGNLALAGVTVVLLHLFLQRTRPGRAMRAVAQNRELAGILGVNVSRTIALAFAINAACAAVAAVLVAPVWLVKYDMGVAIGQKAFYAAVIGGFNQLRGALVGGLVVGLAETLTAAYVSTLYRDAVVLAFLLAVLLWRPEGLLGEAEEPEGA